MSLLHLNDNWLTETLWQWQLLHLLLLLMLLHLLLLLLLLLYFRSADSLYYLCGIDATGACKVDGVTCVVRFQMSLKVIASLRISSAAVAP